MSGHRMIATVKTGQSTKALNNRSDDLALSGLAQSATVIEPTRNNHEPPIGVVAVSATANGATRRELIRNRDDLGVTPTRQRVARGRVHLGTLKTIGGQDDATIARHLSTNSGVTNPSRNGPLHHEESMTRPHEDAELKIA